MRREAAFWLLLSLAAAPLAPQQLRFPAELRPFRFNTLTVSGLPPADDQLLTVSSRRHDGRRDVLFRGAGLPVEQGLECAFYLDAGVQELEVSFRRGPRGPGSLRYPVEARPRIAVYGLDPMELGASAGWYNIAGSPAQLGPGDLRVLERGEGDPGALRAAGIHVLLIGGVGLPGEDSQAGWSGYLLRCSDRRSAGALLTEQRERLLEFQERCTGLLRTARFQGSELTGERELEAGAPADIAYTLLRRQLSPRLGGPLAAALFAFYTPVLAAAAVCRSGRLPVLLAGVLLAGFLAFSLLSPARPRSLRVEFPLPSASRWTGALLQQRGVRGAGREERSYRQEGAAEDGLRLVYRAFLAPGGELPLESFAREPLLRFNQVPEIGQAEGGLRIGFRNPLAAWSLHAGPAAR